MPLQTRIDHFTKVDRIVVPAVLLILILLGLSLDVFGPGTYTIHRECAFTCDDDNKNYYDSKTCQGVDFGNGEEYEFVFQPIKPMNRLNEIHMSAFLHQERIQEEYSVGYYDFVTNLTLYYKENDEWIEWNKGTFTSQVYCLQYDEGRCDNVKWVDEPYFMHSEQKLVVKYVGEKNKFANICIQQYYGSDYYSILRIVTTCFFSIVSIGYIVYYVIYLLVKRIKVKDLDGQQVLNILLMFFGLCYNDPLNLIGLLFPSPFFPIFHGIVHMVFIAYLIFFVVAFFQILRAETALTSKRVEWTVTIFATLIMIISFAFAASQYLKGITENPFNVTLKTETIAWILYTITIVCGIIVGIWLCFIFFSSYNVIKKEEDMRKAMYFCFSSLFIIGMEFVILIISDYSTFFNIVSIPLIVLFGVNAYIFCMFYAFVPKLYNQFNDTFIYQNYNDDEKPILFNQQNDNTEIITPKVDNLDN